MKLVKQEMKEENVKKVDLKDTEAVRAAITEECDTLREMLLGKNEKYGNSALDPVRIFSKANLREQLAVRMDDKLSRIKRGAGIDDGENPKVDLAGYLILDRIADRGEA